MAVAHPMGCATAAYPWDRLTPRVLRASGRSADDLGHRHAQVSELLATITELAQTSTFKDLKSPALVVQESLKSGKVIEPRSCSQATIPGQNGESWRPSAALPAQCCSESQVGERATSW